MRDIRRIPRFFPPGLHGIRRNSSIFWPQGPRNWAQAKFPTLWLNVRDGLTQQPYMNSSGLSTQAQDGLRKPRKLLGLRSDSTIRRVFKLSSKEQKLLRSHGGEVL